MVLLYYPCDLPKACCWDLATAVVSYPDCLRLRENGLGARLQCWWCVVARSELPENIESIGIYLFLVVSFPGCVQSGNEVSVFLRQCDSSKSSRKRRSCWEGRLVGPLDGRWLEGGRGRREGEGEGGRGRREGEREGRESEKGGRVRREGEGEGGRGRREGE